MLHQRLVQANKDLPAREEYFNKLSEQLTPREKLKWTRGYDRAVEGRETHRRGMGFFAVRKEKG